MDTFCYMFRVCYPVLSVLCGLVALSCVMFFLCFVNFSYGVLGEVWYLIVSIPDPCPVLTFIHIL